MPPRLNVRYASDMTRLLAFLLIGSQAFACPVGKSGPPKTKPVVARAKRKPSSSVQLPSSLGERPWGGSDRSLWKPEAILANAASSTLR